MSENKTPEMWEWGIGEKSDSYYDMWAYHKNDEYEIHIFWDKGHMHTVEVMSIVEYSENNDPIYELESVRDYETKSKAIRNAYRKMKELTGD